MSLTAGELEGSATNVGHSGQAVPKAGGNSAKMTAAGVTAKVSSYTGEQYVTQQPTVKSSGLRNDIASSDPSRQVSCVEAQGRWQLDHTGRVCKNEEEKAGL